MQTWSLKANPNAALEQADSFQFSYFLVIAPNNVTPGNPIFVSAGGSQVKELPYPTEIGIMFPWDNSNGPFWGPFGIDSAGNLSNPNGVVMTVPVLPSGPLTPEGMLVAAAITAAGQRNPFGGFVCAYQDPIPPSAPALPSEANFIQTIENSWITHVAVVDFLAATTWTTGSYQTTNDPFTSGVATVPFSTPIALSNSVANTIAALSGWVVKSMPPLQSDYPNFYADDGAVKGSLTPVNYLVGPLGIALGGAIASACYYGRQTGLQTAIEACFKPIV